MQLFMEVRTRVMAVCLGAAVFMMSLVAQASATPTVEASKLTEPIKEEVTGNLTVVLGFIGLIFAIGFIIGWILIRARTAKR